MSDGDISHFVALTNASADEARRYLEGTDLHTAVANYYAAQEGEDDDAEENMETSNAESTGSVPPPSSRPTGAYTLSGEPVQMDPSWTASGGSKADKGIRPTGGPSSGSGFGARVATLGTMGGGGAEDGDDSDDEDDGRKPQELYTGGERSGLAVENPGDRDRDSGRGLVEEILRKAREGSQARPEDQQPSRPAAQGSRSAFTGSGMTLGSDEAPSVPVPDPNARPSRGAAGSGQAPELPRGLLASMLRSLGAGTGVPPTDVPEDEEYPEDEGEVAIRNLTFWKDGFSVGDGPLMRYDEPGNKELLEAIKSGRAPLSVLKVRSGQPVELRVAQRTTEAYQPPPPKPMKPFAGSGNRLGSPVPEITGAASSTATTGTIAMPGGLPGAAATQISAATDSTSSTGFAVDESKPTTSIQIRLADGTRLVSKMNLTHTVGDIRQFVAAAQTASRPFVIQTTFPNKVLDNDSQTIEEAKLQNAVVVQRWA